jgi:ABC-2 type transport system ATP-binding protein
LVPQDLALYDELSARANLRFFGALYSLAGGALDEAIDIALLLANRIAITGSIFIVGPARARLVAEGAVHVDEPS